MNALDIKNLRKEYPTFVLNDISFSIPKGYILGFIGENGAGKTTTIKAILNLISKDGGTVEILGRDIDKHELDIKQDISYMSGDMVYYPKRKLREITKIFRQFFSRWDQPLFDHYMEVFELDPEKQFGDLSKGMKVKYSLALALSHHSKLIICDEPTSSLDPVARDHLLEIFQSIVEDGEVTILFSTHITSDLEKCADYITFIQDGNIIESSSKDDLLASYRLVSGTKEQILALKDQLIAYKQNAFGLTGLLSTKHAETLKDIDVRPCTLDDIMIYYALKRGEHK